MKKRVGVIVIAIGMLFLLADAAGAGGVWGGGRPPGPSGLIWGGGGNAPKPSGMIWGGGKGPPQPPAPSGIVWGGGGNRAGWGPLLEAWLAGIRGLRY